MKKEIIVTTMLHRQTVAITVGKLLRYKRNGTCHYSKKKKIGR